MGKGESGVNPRRGKKSEQTFHNIVFRCGLVILKQPRTIVAVPVPIQGLEAIHLPGIVKDKYQFGDLSNQPATEKSTCGVQGRRENSMLVID